MLIKSEALQTERATKWNTVHGVAAILISPKGELRAEASRLQFLGEIELSGTAGWGEREM